MTILASSGFLTNRNSGGVARKTRSLIHFNGTDASTVFTDEVPPVTWTGTGTAQLSTTIPKFGSAGLILPVNNPDFITSDATIILAPNQAFTMESFVRRPGTGTFSLQMRHAIENDVVRLSYNNATSEIQTLVQDENEVVAFSNNAAATFNVDTWYHTAICYAGGAGGVIEVFWDGSRIASGTSANPTGSCASWRITGDVVIRYDEARISNIVRYSGATYTVPTTEFTAD